MNQNLVTIDGLVAGETAVKPKTGDSDTNVNAYTLSIDNTVVTDFTAVNSYPNAITFAFAQPTKANYVVKKITVNNVEQDAITKGTLIIAAAANNLILDRDDADLANKIKVAAEACDEGVNEDGDPTVLYTVNFAARNLKAEQWYALTLPFKTSVTELSSKLGYAVVNILDETNADATKVRFKLHMQDIEANEPFLVKVYKQIDLANTDLDDDHATLDPLTFAGKTIAYVETPSVKDAKGTQFIGTFMGYQTPSTVDDEYYMATSNGGWYQHGYTRPSGAYLKVAEGVHARILIEEPDGTTSIHTLTANGEMVPAQGWYTLNGVKLQGVPTEKGIYINNGKKVVIK